MLTDLSGQADHVWARHAVSELDGFIASQYYDSVEAHSITQADSDRVQGFNEELDDLPEFSPLRANALRAFEWDSRSRVLEIGCGAGVTTSFLAGLDLHVDAVEPDRSLAQLAALRTRRHESVRIIAESLASLDFESSRYDVIVISGSDAFHDWIKFHPVSYPDAVTAVLETCKSLLKEQGKVYFSIENEFAINQAFAASYRPQNHAARRTGTAYSGHTVQSMSLQKWREFLSGIFRQVDEYYLYPSMRFPRVLLGSSFASATPTVFQHLASNETKMGFKSSAKMVNQSLLYQIASINGCLGELSDGYLFVLQHGSASSNHQLDFAHLPDFDRRPEFVSVVLKKAGQPETMRLKVNAGEIAEQTGIVQSLEAETYYSGITLSVLWRNSLIDDPRGIKFEQYLLAYFAYLKKLDSGVIAGKNIDAISNNIIVDADDEYRLIDLEWHLPDEKLKCDYIYYRGVIHFAIRYAAIFDDFRWINGLATLGDFAAYCFRMIGINIGIAELEIFRKRDCQFMSSVLRHSEGYSLSDPLGVEADPKTTLCRLSWRYPNEYYHPDQKKVCYATAHNKNQILTFHLPGAKAEATAPEGDGGQPVACIRFFPFEHLQAPGAGYFGIDSLIVRGIAENESSQDLMVLENSDQVSQANIHRGIFYGKKENRHVFMFNNNDTFLEFELPLDEQHTAKSIEVVLDFRFSPSQDYETARYQYALAQRATDTAIEIKNAEINLLKEELEDITREYYEIKESRVWRLLIAYRDSFKISGYPKKNVFQKLAHMVRLIRHPRPDDDR